MASHYQSSYLANGFCYRMKESKTACLAQGPLSCLTCCTCILCHDLSGWIQKTGSCKAKKL